MFGNYRKQGLTLIEVLLAILILAIGITVLLSTASRCLAVAKKARHYENARRLLGEIELIEPLPPPDEMEEDTQRGTFENGFEDYSWTRIIEETGEEEDSLFKITMSVEWSERRGQSKEEVVTYYHAPEVKKGGNFVVP